MTPLEALRNLKMALRDHGISSGIFESAVYDALHVLSQNQCANCGCLLKARDRKRIEGERVCAICGEHIERLRR